ncbi:MAG TPA: bacteriophage holin [Candidatus Omnitrophota bacterium]|nr:bacteriophage holin [Candidatus Omnitrophota bacterium]HPD84674.1 bacteriophage holin [Candidatus Omnitrophota bacterium]HRZ03532.1 bacteriophage holin [Candidatus Omnitrophota bacterium]
MKLSVKAFALTCAIVWAAYLFLMTWWLIAFGGKSDDLAIIGKFYFGYTVTPMGSLIGLAWGLVDGAICGAVFAWVYNRLVK